MSDSNVAENSDRCAYVYTAHAGQPHHAVCGAPPAAHGDGLGKIGGHAFVATEPVDPAMVVDTIVQDGAKACFPKREITDAMAAFLRAIDGEFYTSSVTGKKYFRVKVGPLTVEQLTAALEAALNAPIVNEAREATEATLQEPWDGTTESLCRILRSYRHPACDAAASEIERLTAERGRILAECNGPFGVSMGSRLASHIKFILERQSG